MNTTVEMPLRSLNPILVRDLQEKYPGALVRIEVEETAPGSSSGMDENRFWSIIALFDWGRKQNEDIVAPVVKALSAFSEADIFRFEDLLAQKLFSLDGEKYAAALGWNDAGNAHFSVDGFLYARCCVVANGKRFYEKVLNNPSLMPQNCTFEPLLYLAEKAHRMKTGGDTYDYLPPISYETFSNHTAWHGMPSLKDLLNGNVQ